MGEGAVWGMRGSLLVLGITKYLLTNLFFDTPIYTHPRNVAIHTRKLSEAEVLEDEQHECIAAWLQFLITLVA